MGFDPRNVILCDTKGVVYRGRQEGMNQWKSAHAVDTTARTLAEALEGADVFYGLSVKGALTPDMLRGMADNPIVFAMANPDPEITPEEARATRADVIIATGRSDYPNQINNVLGFPYIFRGALDVRAKTINMEMKIAATKALADLAREDVPDEVANAYRGARPRFGRDYIIPAPFDPRLISIVPPAVALAAMDTGVARRPIVDMKAYRAELSARRDPIAGLMQTIHERVRRDPKRVVFAEGEEEQVIRAALAFVNQGFGRAVLVGREDRVREAAANAGLELPAEIEIHNAELSQPQLGLCAVPVRAPAAQGPSDARLPAPDQSGPQSFRRGHGGAGRRRRHGDGRDAQFLHALEDVRRVIDHKPGHRVIGVSIVLANGRVVFVADTAITEMPDADELAEIAIEAAGVARRIGLEPRVAMLAFSTFGYPPGERTARVHQAVNVLDQRRVDFEYEGEMGADIALNKDPMSAYPFSRLTETANVLVMPAFHSAAISTKMLQELGGATVLGPLIVGLDKPVQIVQLGATDTDIVNMAALAAFGVGG